MADEPLKLDAKRTAMLILDLQNDVMIDGGAFAESGAPEHAKEQNVVENVKSLADAMRKAGGHVIHVWYIVEEGAPGLKLNAPLFDGVKDTNALVRGVWLEAGVHVVRFRYRTPGLVPGAALALAGGLALAGWAALRRRRKLIAGDAG